MRWTMREALIKRVLVDQIVSSRRKRILDLACGTGTLPDMLLRAAPEASILGIDGDPEVLALAQRKTDQTGMRVCFVRGLVQSLPFQNGSIDCVVSSFAFHHLDAESKLIAATEAFRVLTPEGECWIADFGKPRGHLMSAIAFIMKSFEETEENFAGMLPSFLRQAGFERVEETWYVRTIFGPMAILQAGKSRLNH